MPRLSGQEVKTPPRFVEPKKTDCARAISKTMRNDAKMCTGVVRNRLYDGSTPYMVQSFLGYRGKNQGKLAYI